LLATGSTSSGSKSFQNQPQSEYERDVPLWAKYDTRAIRRIVADLLGIDETGTVIALHLYEAHRTSGRRTSYSRSKNFYQSHELHRLLTYRRVIRAVDELEAAGLIHNDKRAPGERGWQSSMIGTPALFEQMSRVLACGARLPVLTPKNTILLRDASGNELFLRPTRDLARRSHDLEMINEAIISADVRSEQDVNLACSVRRIYNLSLNRGGRMYAMGVSWQNMPKIQRDLITINGEPGVELDYGTLHPTMLYAIAEKPIPSDCYSIGEWSRRAAKQGLLTVINAPSESSALASLAWNVPFLDVPPGCQEAFELASKLMRDLKHVHKPISGAFHSDAGARLMRKDSDLAVSVLKTLLKRGDMALPIHDSFIVPATRRDALEEAMSRCASDIGLQGIAISSATPLAA
jgi:hypothetical protein